MTETDVLVQEISFLKEALKFYADTDEWEEAEYSWEFKMYPSHIPAYLPAIIALNPTGTFHTKNLDYETSYFYGKKHQLFFGKHKIGEFYTKELEEIRGFVADFIEKAYKAVDENSPFI